MSRYLAVFTLTVVGFGLWAFLGGTFASGSRAMLPVGPIEATFFALLMVASSALVLVHRRRFLSLIVISIVGLVVTLTFVRFSAPDLALTQLTVEVVSVILLLLALNYLPKGTPVESGGLRRGRDALIALLAGGGVGALAFAILTRDMSLPSIAAYHVENSYTGGAGNNVVNVILVDFRGFDTMGEIMVLGIAGMIIYALIEVVLNGPAGQRLRRWRSEMPQAQDRHPLLMVVVTRIVLPLALLVGVYIYLRGHNMPGGGFIAGLVVSIALLMQYMASGFGWSEARQRFDYHAVIAVGVFLAVLTGLGSLLFGWNFLTSSSYYQPIWGLYPVHLVSAAIFDLGVMLTVIGSVMLALASLSRIGQHAGEGVNLTPMDVDPQAGQPGEGR
jgi:multicomponent K+:H+ antiporter subunit A